MGKLIKDNKWGKESAKSIRTKELYFEFNRESKKKQKGVENIKAYQKKLCRAVCRRDESQDESISFIGENARIIKNVKSRGEHVKM